MINRIVMVSSPTPERVDKVLDAFEQLRDKVPGLLRIETAVDHGGRSLGYDRMFVLTFQNAESIEVWKHQPAHIPIREELAACGELLVFEYGTEGSRAPAAAV